MKNINDKFLEEHHDQMKNDLEFSHNNIFHCDISTLDKPNQEDKDKFVNSKVNIHDKKEVTEVTDNSTYNLPIRVTFFIDTIAMVHIFGSNLNWKTLLQDIQYNKARIQWHFYNQRDSRKSSSKTKDDSNMDREKFKYMQRIKENVWCCICHESNSEYEHTNKPLVLPCGHIYHPECIARWLGSKNTCPMCRYEMPQC